MPTKVLLKQKLLAFICHLSLSMVFALSSLFLVYYIWYPAPLDIATNVTHLFLLMLSIDIILGPILTFIVYKKGKKTLKFDLSVIILIQLSALIYGLSSVYSGRPAWIVYNVDRFDLVRVNDIDERRLSEASSNYQRVGFFGPKYVAAIIPSDDIERKTQILFEEVNSGIAPSQHPELYMPLSEVKDLMIQRSQKLDTLNKFNKKTKVKRILSTYPDANAFVPLKANQVDMTVLINKNDGSVIKIVDLRPWKSD